MAVAGRSPSRARSNRTARDAHARRRRMSSPRRGSAVLEVPEVDEDGRAVADLYRLEIVPDLVTLPAFRHCRVSRDDGRRSAAARGRRPLARSRRATTRAGASVSIDDERRPERLGALSRRAPAARSESASGASLAQLDGCAKGVVGGTLMGIRGDTRGGDFALVRLDVNHTPRARLDGRVRIFESDASASAATRDESRASPAAVSLLGPCAAANGSGSEARSERPSTTVAPAARRYGPIALYGVLNPLGNGQSPSYDGAAPPAARRRRIEHVGPSSRGRHDPAPRRQRDLPARTPRRSLEAYGGAGYRVDPTTPATPLRVERRFAGTSCSVATASAPLADAVDPWGVGSHRPRGRLLVLDAAAHSYAELAPPFVSAVHSGTWQLLADPHARLRRPTF